MRLAALIVLPALLAFAGAPAEAQTPAAPGAQAVSAPSNGGDEDIPPGAPADDYGFVSWCYGALGEYLDIYKTIKPELKAIDARFGASVNEPEPYMSDVAEEHKALERFGEAMQAAERASPTPIADQGQADVALGRRIWSIAKLQPPRKLADAWLFWGVPNRCETTAKSLMTRSALLGQVLNSDSPSPATH